MLSVVSFLKGQRKPNWEEGGGRREERKEAKPSSMLEENNINIQGFFLWTRPACLLSIIKLFSLLEFLIVLICFF
jgi:hypothetical protein